LPVCPEKRFLDDVFGVLGIAGHAVREPVDSPAVSVHERPEGFAISIARERDSGGVRMRHPND
jgi:hypothetical protein